MITLGVANKAEALTRAGLHNRACCEVNILPIGGLIGLAVGLITISTEDTMDTDCGGHCSGIVRIDGDIAV
ncbi:unnamed protein product [Protopolystoma xenopodis]|uniref:Uncharacterized protein n=1 Tax=Protopolystoma xenopodis TaxID=117903 RepID=A0A3S5AVZ8_9PLAT|nr:unnamed protein product [Protopolystoma xenopodis]